MLWEAGGRVTIRDNIWYKNLEEDIKCVFEIICDSLQIQSQIEMAEIENFAEEQERSELLCQQSII